jgi:hypothetical protein
LVGKPEGKSSPGKHGVDRIILEWILRKYCGKVWARCI